MSRSLSLSRVFATGAVLALTAAVAAPLTAQQHPNHVEGFQPERLYQLGDLDNVNLFNGNLTVQIPIGGTYSTGGDFSYQLVLTYSGNIWEYESIRDSVDGHDKLRAVPRQASNAGVGWQVSLGGLEAGGYRGPDGSVSPLLDTLHPGGSSTKDYRYTRNGTYLRENATVSPKVLEFPDGTRRYFDGANRLTKVADRFDNSLTVTLIASGVTGIDHWRLDDSQTRRHWVYFKQAPALAGRYQRGVVDRVVIQAFGGKTATYTFHYATPQVTRGLTDSSLPCKDGPTTETVPVLEKIVYTSSDLSEPVSTPYTFAYDLGPYHVPCDSGGSLAQTNSTSGHLIRMTLPTGGAIEWDWQYYLFPKHSEKVAPFYIVPPAFIGPITPFTSSAGIIERRMKTPSGATAGRWKYQQVFSSIDGIREGIRKVTDPLENETNHYFSVYACKPGLDGCPNEDPDSGGWSRYDYGLPFTRFATDSTGTRFLSSEVHQGTTTTNQQIKRRIYLRYESSGLGVNQRVASERTVFVDDGSRYADVDHSSFDGLGHYRQTTTGGNFGSGDVRTSFTNFNPGSCATCTPGTGTAWVLDTFTYQQVTEGGVTAWAEACFEGSTGFLLRGRTLKTGTTQGATDLVTRYSKDLSGNVTAEESFGGDTQSVPTGGLCGLALPAPKYKIDHAYQYGSLKTSQYSGQTFKLADFDIDQNTGRVKTSRDSTLLATTYEYDAMGRLTWVKPSQEGWTQYTYANASGTSTPAKAFIYRKSNGGGTVLAQEEVHFDPFGRVAVERRKMADGTLQNRTTAYNDAGHLQSRTEWGTTAKTNYTGYDPFGRPGTITPPDGAAHAVTLGYTGVRRVTRTVKVGTGWNGTAVTETSSTTTETYDRQGRLYQVTEPSNADGSLATTTYAYDVGGRLKQVTQTAKDGTGTNRTQTRKLNYDNRGFLTSEQHPEKGASGNGTVNYFNYDARGHATRIVDGPSDLTFTFDSAERVTQVKETGTGGRVLKAFTYATANGTGDYRLGKLQVARGYNHVVIGTTPYTVELAETYVYGGKQGRVSSRATQTYVNGGAGESFTQSWTWTDLGNPASVNYPKCTHAGCTATTSRIVPLTYTNGFLTAVNNYASSITYHPNGQVNQVTHINDPANTATWVTDTWYKDPYNQLRPNKIDAKTAGGTVLWNSGLHAYDGAGNMTKAGNAYFLYDPVSRVKNGRLYLGAGAGGTEVTFNHAYDGFGNLLSLTANGAGRNTPTAPETNRLTGLTGQITYDTAGNLTGWNGALYEYDRLHQMWHMKNGTEDWLYLYTADGERIWSYSIAGKPSRWTLRDLDGKVLREYQDAGGTWTIQRDYVYRGSQLLAAHTADAAPKDRIQYHVDHLGTPRAITNKNGARIAYHVYYPFGEEATSPTQDGERMKFTGHERDLANTTSAADDLDYMHARFYNPQTGRLLSVDPSKESWDGKQPQSWNRYTYTQNNPLNFVDPDGKARVCSPPESCAAPTTWWEKAQRDLELAGMLPGPAPLAVAGRAGGTALGSLLSRVGQFFGRAGSGADDAINVARVAQRFAAVEGRASILQKVIRPDGSLNVGQKVAGQLAGERAYIPTQSILETIGSGTRVADPQGVKGLYLYSANATYKGSKGVLEVLVDERSGKVFHVLFKAVRK